MFPRVLCQFLHAVVSLICWKCFSHGFLPVPACSSISYMLEVFFPRFFASSCKQFFPLEVSFCEILIAFYDTKAFRLYLIKW